MKFLKALQKTEAEQPPRDSHDQVKLHGANEAPTENATEDFSAQADLKIGAPGFKKNGTSHLVADKLNTKLAGEEMGPLSISTSDLTLDWESVPEFVVDPSRVNPHLVSITQPSSAFSEEYRSLRTQIIHSSQRRLLQSIVVASVGSAEGKSVTALNLSWLMAQTDGIRALLIDGDLRMPSLANYLGFETETGLSQVLAGEVSFNQSIIRLQPAGLCLLPGGKSRPDVAELISGPKLGEILEEARELFDFVIIDAPPLGIFTDASVLINNADGALLVVRADHTRYKDIERTLETLPRDKMLGVVLNQSEDVLLGNSYYDYAYAKTYLS